MAARGRLGILQHKETTQDETTPTRESRMTDRRGRDEERDRHSRKEDERQREDKERRSDELQEAWRRHHPSEDEEREKGRPDKGGRV